jgi:hypothetical protein
MDWNLFLTDREFPSLQTPLIQDHSSLTIPLFLILPCLSIIFAESARLQSVHPYWIQFLWKTFLYLRSFDFQSCILEDLAELDIQPIPVLASTSYSLFRPGENHLVTLLSTLSNVSLSAVLIFSFTTIHPPGLSALAHFFRYSTS